LKTIKTTLAKTGTSLYIKGLIAGLFTGTIALIFLLLIFSLLLLISGTLPHDYLLWFGIGASVVSVFLCAYICSRIIKHNGLVWGLVSGLIFFLIEFISGLCVNDSQISYITFIKLALFSLAGCLGGIKGVNKKEKLKIK